MSFVLNPPTSIYHPERIGSEETISLGALGQAKKVVQYDSSGNEILSGAGSSIGDGRQIVTTAGTRVQLSAASVACKRVTICAETDNTSYIVVGGSNVVATLATRQGIPLGAGDTLTLQINNLNLIYLDSLVNGEGVNYQYVN